MPPKTRRKTAPAAATASTARHAEKSNGVAPAALPPSSTRRTRAEVEDSEQEEALRHVLVHHRLPTAPRCYMDLFAPILQHSARLPCPHRHAKADNDEATAPLAKCVNGSLGTTAKEETDDTSAFEPAGERGVAPRRATANSRDRRAVRAADLVAFVFPKTVAAHLNELALDSGEEAEEKEEAVARKRRRGSVESASDADNADSTAARDVADEAASRLRRLVDVLSSASFAERYLPAYRNDSEYLRQQDVGHVLHQWRISAAGLGFSATYLTMAFDAGLDVFTHLIPCIQAVTEVYMAHCRHRLAAMAIEPRVLRVGKKLRMSERETAALTFLLMCHSGSLLASSTGLTLTLNTLAYYAGLTPQECLDFVSTHRLHVKQGLITSDVQTRNSFAESRLAMPQEAVAALTGNELTEEQLIKLERTALADVLAEEKARKQQEAAAAAAAAAADKHRHKQQAQEQPQLNRGHSNANGTPAQDGTMAAESDEEVHHHNTHGRSTCTHSEARASNGSEEEEDDDDDNDLEVALDGGRVDAASVQDALDRLGVNAAALPGNLTVESIQASLQQQQRLGTGSSGVGGDKAEEKADNEPEGRHHHNAATAAAASSPKRAKEAAGEAADAPDTQMHKPYTTDFEYMEEAFKVIASLIRLRTTEGDMKDEDDNFVPRSKMEATMRELKGKVRVSTAIHSSRVAATLALAEETQKAEEAAAAAAAVTGHALPSTAPPGQQPSAGTAFLPRIEQLSQRLQLGELEKSVMLLMVGSVVSHDILVAINGRYVMREGQQRYLTVGYILFVLCEGLQERVAARRVFYQAAPLIANGILSLNLDAIGTSRSPFNTDLMDYVCDVDRKMVDYVMGSTTETAEMVPGSSLYYPTVPMDNVVLPAQTTKLVLSTIEHYGMFERCKAKCGFGEGLGSTASGLAMLFYGPSGTGKTMLANAVAHNLKKRLLLVNVSQFKAEKRAPEMMRFLFREAKLNDAIIFFDECEALFESRETNPLVTSVLTEFEKNDGLIIMATNMAQVMDEAMNRRISLMVEFKLPSHPMRQRIWQRHMPQGVALAADVSLEKLALNYELSGGLIRNAVLAALNHAVARENTEAPTLHMEDLEDGAKRQLRGFFLAARLPGGASGGSGSGGSGSIRGAGAGSEAYVTPRRTLAELSMEPQAKRRVEQVARLAKSRSTLFSQWGFSEEACQDQGSVYLFTGPSGTGKSLAAEGIAYECGATIRLCNVRELLLLRELNVAAVFEEGRQLGAVIVFDEAQELFTHAEKALHISQLIQYYAVRYPRPVIVIATTGGGDTAGSLSSSGGGLLGGVSEGSLDIHASGIHFSERVSFKLPDRALRKELWRAAFPAKVPLAEDVDFDVLSERKVSAKLLRRVAFTVCCKAAAAATTSSLAALAADGGAVVAAEARKVSMKAIVDELTRCLIAEESRNPARGMFA